MIRLIGVISLLLIFSAPSQAADYPAAAGFDTEGSDPQAIAIADASMEAMGGYEAWNQTRYITWRFFGGRLHVWDKWTGDIRFEQDDLTVLMNINNRQGSAWRDGQELTDPDSLQAALERGYRSWINDAYWLVMPYKLKDSGVTLTYRGAGQSENGHAADVLTLTFAEVGVTPQNKYEVWVDKKTKLVSQWAFYGQASDAEPRFTGPWDNWQRHGQIMLSDSRGERGHTDLAVFSQLPESIFKKPQPVDMMKITQ
jgi:hypothetical protein